MPHKLNIPLEKQVEGTRKAIANPKTPKHLIPHLRKRLAQLEAETEKPGHQMSLGIPERSELRFPLPEPAKRILRQLRIK